MDLSGRIFPSERAEVWCEETSEGRPQADPLARGGRQRADALARGGRQGADLLARGGRGTRGEPLARGSARESASAPPKLVYSHQTSASSPVKMFILVQ